MTNEEAIRYCDEYLARHISDIDKEFLKKAKEALQQQPCDDCVSRQAVLDLLENTNNGWIINKVLQLPPVNPQEPKTRHWIKEKTIHGWDGKSYQCSECGRSIHLDLEVENLNDYPYCHCGAKMQEVKE